MNWTKEGREGMLQKNSVSDPHLNKELKAFFFFSDFPQIVIEILGGRTPLWAKHEFYLGNIKRSHLVNDKCTVICLMSLCI